MATSISLKFVTLKWNISRTIWRIEVGDGSFFFCIFHALSFELNFFFDQRFPLILQSHYHIFIELKNIDRNLVELTWIWEIILFLAW